MKMNANNAILSLRTARAAGAIVVAFLPDDIKTLEPDWSPKECAAALLDIRKHAEGRLTSLGWEVLRDCLQDRQTFAADA